MNIMYESSFISDGNYLMHHGIKGQKWGVRRFQNEDGTWTDAGKRRRGVGLIARTKTRLTHPIRQIKSVAKNTKHAKGIVDKASNLVGNKSWQTYHNEYSKTESMLRDQSKTRLGKHLHDVRSYNHAQYANYFGKRAKRNAGQRIINSVFDRDLLTTPVKTITGRKSNVGKEAYKALAVAITAYSVNELMKRRYS